MKKGNILIIAVIFIACAIAIILFIAAIFLSHVNSILYNMKLDMYSINKASIIAVNKYSTSIDNFSYNQKAYREYFEDAIKKNYSLDDDFRNESKLISYIKIIDYDIYEEGEKDSWTKEKSDDRTIHTILEVKIRPIIMKDFFENIFKFTIHEDVNLNMVNMEG